MKRKNRIVVQGVRISIFQNKNQDYVSLTNIARYKAVARTNYIIQNWMRNKNVVEFLGLWEKINNMHFKGIEFDAFKNQAGSNSFSLTPQKWIEKTGAIGIIVQAGRYEGGVFAHIDIALEFASWISPEFKLYLIKEFQRLKSEESDRLKLDWNLSRSLAKINYKIHTDSIKNHLIPRLVSSAQTKFVYASEADVLNVALFGHTAKQWHKEHPGKTGNIRDYADVRQLVVLANLESMNAELIREEMTQSKRLLRLNSIAIAQMKSLLGSARAARLQQESSQP